jgi:hypothetical protein
MGRQTRFCFLTAITFSLFLPVSVHAQELSEKDEQAKQIAKNSGLWFLKFKHDKLRWISMNNDLGVKGGKIPHEFSGSSKQLRTENYWYIFYTITNKEETDHRIFINITAESDKNKNILSKRGKKKKSFISEWDQYRVKGIDEQKADAKLNPQSLFRSRYRKRYHDVKDPAVFKKVEAILRYRGKLKKGEALHSQLDLTIPSKKADLNADPATRKLAMPTIKAGETKKCVAIFRKFDVEMDWAIITFRGLSNDQIVGFPEDHRRNVTENILQLVFERRGSNFFTANKTPKFVSKKWIAVKRTIKTDLKSPKNKQ